MYFILSSRVNRVYFISYYIIQLIRSHIAIKRMLFGKSINMLIDKQLSPSVYSSFAVKLWQNIAKQCFIDFYINCTHNRIILLQR